MSTRLKNLLTRFGFNFDRGAAPGVFKTDLELVAMKWNVTCRKTTDKTRKFFLVIGVARLKKRNDFVVEMVHLLGDVAKCLCETIMKQNFMCVCDCLVRLC